MSRTKLLVVGDAGVNTGFERVVRGICEHLLATDRYDITVRGVGYYDDASALRRYPYPVKPWGGDQTDPLGVTNFTTWLDEDKPDALLLVQDLWNIVHYQAWKPRELPSVVYFPVDCPNMKWNYALGAAAASEAVSYTAFGARETAAGLRHAIDVIRSANDADAELLDAKALWLSMPNPRVPDMELHARADRTARLQNLDRWHVVPHGMEQGVFEPRDKTTCRKLFDLPVNAFIVLNVNTNQFRKRQDLTIRMFAQFLKLRPDAWLVLHCQGRDKGGWDLQQLTHYYGVAHRTTITSTQRPNLTDDALVSLYNTADIQVNTGGGEGWGLTAMEGAACGVPQAVPDWSATRELWREHGLLLPVSDWRHEPKGLNTAHAIVDPRQSARLLFEATRDDSFLSTLRTLSLEQAARQVSWDAVGGAFDTILQRALDAPAPLPISLNEAVDFRIGEVRSELAGCVDMEDVQARG